MNLGAVHVHVFILCELRIKTSRVRQLKIVRQLSALNPGAVFLRFFTVAFVLFLTPLGGSNPEWPTF